MMNKEKYLEAIQDDIRDHREVLNQIVDHLQKQTKAITDTHAALKLLNDNLMALQRRYASGHEGD